MEIESTVAHFQATMGSVCRGHRQSTLLGLSKEDVTNHGAPSQSASLLLGFIIPHLPPITSLCRPAQSILKNSWIDSWKVHYWGGYFKLLNFTFKNSEGWRPWPLEMPLRPQSSIRILFVNSGGSSVLHFYFPYKMHKKLNPVHLRLITAEHEDIALPLRLSQTVTNWPQHLLGLSLSCCPCSVAHSGNRTVLSYDSVQLNILCNDQFLYLTHF